MLAAGCALKSRFWCATQQKLRLKLAFITPQKHTHHQKSALFFNTALQDGSGERNIDREANPAGSQMACRPVVFCVLWAAAPDGAMGGRARGAIIAMIMALG